MAGKGEKLIAENRRARHDYHLLDRFEAGVQLTGTEVKSLRDGRVTLGQAYADLRNGEVWLIGAHIDEYAQGNVANHEPERDRKLLLHRREIESLIGQVQQKGLTLVPTRMYFKNGRVKLELAVGRGKEQRDKRRDIAKRDAQRDIERALRRRSLIRSSNSSSSPSSSSQCWPMCLKPRRLASASDGSFSGLIEAMKRWMPCSREAQSIRARTTSVA